MELAGEIVVDFPDKKVTLVHRGSRLLEFIGAKASKKALDWLTSKKVEVLLNQSVDINTASDGTYQTSGGETIIADCHFVCTGKPIGSSWLKDTILKDNLDGHGKLVVDDNLRVRGLKNVFAIGDITAIPVSLCRLSFFLFLIAVIYLFPITLSQNETKPFLGNRYGKLLYFAHVKQRGYKSLIV